GTSMENEPYTQNTSQVFILQKKEMLVPPSYKLSAFGFAIGFWLTFDEVQEYILKGKSVSDNTSEVLQNWGNIEVMTK
ncbi:MAG: hypothetical protein QXP59_06445, partial [Saccharolobus sp.]